MSWSHSKGILSSKKTNANLSIAFDTIARLHEKVATAVSACNVATLQHKKKDAYPKTNLVVVMAHLLESDLDTGGNGSASTVPLLCHARHTRHLS